MSVNQNVLYSVDQVRELDRLAIEDTGISGYELMCRAGQAAFDQIRQRWPEARRLTVFCGAGNNAGDGYVIARLAHENNMSVHVYYLSAPAGLANDAQRAWQNVDESGVSIEQFISGIRLDAGVIVDALLGTGIRHDLKGDWLTAINCMNASPQPVVSIDIPSGIHADTGQVMGAAVHARMTISFIGMKKGLFTADAPDYCGNVVFDDLGVPDNVYRQVASEGRLLCDTVRCALNPRPRTAHKGDNGHVLIIGGNSGMAGSVILAGRAALSSGAGLVSIATRPEHIIAAVAACPELMVHGVNGKSDLKPLLEKATTVIIGPGLGQDEWALSLLGAVLERHMPTVVDADALNLLAREPCRCENRVLTPHPAEAGRLLGISTKEITADRYEAVKLLQKKYAGIVLLKGAGTLIAEPEIRVCAGGNPGMATAGMGDVLSGVIAALIAQGLTMAHAVELGVWVHASAADMQARERGERGMLAGDLLPSIRQLVNV